jgi:competence protein ComEA
MGKIKKHLNWLVATVGFLILTSFIIIFLIANDQPETNFANAQISQLPEPAKPAIKQQVEKEENKKIVSAMMIDVQGSVVNPGVYKMNEGDRVIHAIEKAGGFLPDAEIRSVNQAQKISDEMVIYVAGKGEEYDGQIQAKEHMEMKININAADAPKLQELSGVGPSKAESIIAYREENGPFTSIEQLLEVRGIGEKTIEEWKDKIVFQ